MLMKLGAIQVGFVDDSSFCLMRYMKFTDLYIS